MTKQKTNKSQTAPLPEENKDRVSKIANEIIEPALRKAVADSKEVGTEFEIVSAVATAYGAMLVDLLGSKAAASYMSGHAKHIKSLEVSAPTISDS